MRVLMVLHAAPCSPALGPARRHLHLFEEISRRHTVSVITFGGSRQREQFERDHNGRYERAVFIAKRPRAIELLVASWFLVTCRCVFRRLYTRRMQHAIRELIAGGKFDVVYVSTLLLGCYRFSSGVRVIGDAHNIEHEVLARTALVARNPVRKVYCRMQSALTRDDEWRCARNVSEVWATSAREAEHFADVRGDGRVEVVPNGIRCHHDPRAVAALRSREGPTSSPVLLFVGLMSYFPNRDAVGYFRDQILPLITVRLPGARFVVVGADPPRSLLSRPAGNVTIVGRVADVAPYFAQATIVVAPLRCGGGTPVKVLEAMAYGVPVVSTSRGCEGLAVRDRESVLLADTPDAFAEAVYELSVTPALAHRLSRAAADVIRAEYDWARIGDGIHRVLAPSTVL